MEKLKLQFPIKITETETISELNFKKPVAKDMRAMPLDITQGDLLNLAGSLCLQPPSVMDKLEMPDYLKVIELVGGFMQGGPQIGEKS